MKSAVLVVAALCVALHGTSGRLPAAESWKVDPVHSSVIFKVKHMEAANFYGRFNEVSGSFTIDEADPSKSAFDIQVKAASIDTANAKRDQHLSGPDFFNVKQFPLITFKGTKISKAPDGTFEATGNLTLHGVTKEVTVRVERTGTGKGQRGPIAGFEAVLKIRRTDFGMKYMVGPLGDEVQITVSLECGATG